jgi:hypothetical protein
VSRIIHSSYIGKRKAEARDTLIAPRDIPALTWASLARDARAGHWGGFLRIGAGIVADTAKPFSFIGLGPVSGSIVDRRRNHALDINMLREKSGYS